MGELTVSQYGIVVNVYALTLACMGVAAAFFLLQRDEVLPRYRTSVMLLGLMAGVAAYSYSRLHGSWADSFSVVNGTLRASGIAFNEGYRYVDWLLTMPMTLMALVHVLDIPPRQARSRGTVLSILAAEMIVLSYPGQIATTMEARWLWWGVAMVPAVVIVYQLYAGLSATIAAEPPAVRRSVRQARLVLVLAYAAYPAFYLLPMFGAVGGLPFTALQIGYAVTDILAKVVLGWMLYRIAVVKSLPVEDAPVLAGSLRAVKA